VGVTPCASAGRGVCSVVGLGYHARAEAITLAEHLDDLGVGDEAIQHMENVVKQYNRTAQLFRVDRDDRVHPRQTYPTCETDIREARLDDVWD